MQKIYHQGHFDGACFLYSVVNAYSALTGHEVEQELWEEALKWIPFRGDYISEIGTQRIDDDINLYSFTIKRILRELKGGKNLNVDGFKTITSPIDLKSTVTKDSVLIFNKKGEHWMVGVDYNDVSIATVCSAELVDKQKEYKESWGENFGRRYNRIQKYAKFGWLYTPSAIVLRR